MYPGDPGFPPGTSGLNKKWWNFSPRAGVAWDVRGDGRTAVRTSYGSATTSRLANTTTTTLRRRRTATARCFRTPRAVSTTRTATSAAIRIRSQTTPNTEFLTCGAFCSMDPDINAPRVQSWNVTLEQQLGPDWGGASAILAATRTACGGRSSSIPASSWGRPLRDPGRLVSRVHHERQSEPAARAVAVRREPGVGALIGNLDCHGVGDPELPRLEALGQAAAASGVCSSTGTTRCRDASASTRWWRSRSCEGSTNPGRPRNSTAATATGPHAPRPTAQWATRRRMWATGSSALSPPTGGCPASSTRVRAAG